MQWPGLRLRCGQLPQHLRSAELYDPASGTWAATGILRTGREFHTATLLTDGDVLVTGGFSNCDDDFCSDVSSAELYKPATGRWSPAGSMHGAREQHTATLLADGRVLVAGGLNEGGFGSSHRYATAQLFDPTTVTWTVTATMAQVHIGHTATLLRNGWVLVAGGQTAAAEIYEPQLGGWVSPGVMSTVRTHHTATLLPDGRVLVAGGTGPDGQAQATAELFLGGHGPLVTIAPTGLTFGAVQVGTTSAPLAFTVTNNGSADLAVSGVTVSGSHPSDFTAANGCTTASVPPGGSCVVSVRFAPTTTGLRTATVAVVDDAPLSPQGAAVSGYGAGPNSWAPTSSMAAARDGSAATLLSDGRVLVAAGEDGVAANPLASAELYDPASHAFTATGALVTGRAFAAATRLRDGDVLIAGGKGANFANLASAELYHPATGTWSGTASMKDSGYGITSTLLPNGRVLVTGLGFGSGAEVYIPATARWTDTGPMPATESFATATLLPSGKVLVAGGGTAAAELYDPAGNAWTTTGSMATSRRRPTASLLADGQVLVAGGQPSGGDALSSAELYDPTAGSWASTGSMSVGRFGHTATLLTNGLVLVAGGCTGSCGDGAVEASAEAYNGGYWYRVAPMTVGRYQHTATLLGNGEVLVAGGDPDACCRATDAAEVYIPTLLDVAPSGGPAGQRVTLSGSGFFAGEVVKLTWDYSVAAIAHATTTADGTFAVRATVPAAATGTHTITARGESSFAGAQVTFEVTGSP